jgi:hypothetical protein
VIEELAEQFLCSCQLVAQGAAQRQVVGQFGTQRPGHDAPPAVGTGQGLANTARAWRSTLA